MSAGRHIANNDLRNQAAYPLGEAARYLKLPTATLRAWTLGRPYPTTQGAGHFRAVIRPAATEATSLSFWNLIEAHVLRALRTEHGVSIKAVRRIDAGETPTEVALDDNLTTLDVKQAVRYERAA